MKNFSLAALAAHIGAQLDSPCHEQIVIGIKGLHDATASHVSFYTNRAYRKALRQTQAAAIILAPRDRQDCPVPALIMDNPYLGYAKAAALFQEIPPFQAHIHPSAVIDLSAKISPNARIDAHVVIDKNTQIDDFVHILAGCVIGKNVQIGEKTLIYPNVTVYDDVSIGKCTIIHSGAVLGADGFGLAHSSEGWVKIPQLGSVQIGDNVEIGANTTIDRGALGNTVIGNGVKLDNQIQIAHNVHIGDHTVIAGCTGIAGSTKLGQRCMIGGGVCIAGHLEVVDNVQITGGSIVIQSILEAGMYSSGVPLQNNKDWHKNFLRFKELDDMARRLRRLEKQ
jgi:UDP-3-O-[3-hydroxymyristoyl] glucosamine N-acyltransferase